MPTHSSFWHVTQATHVEFPFCFVTLSHRLIGKADLRHLIISASSSFFVHVTGTDQLKISNHLSFSMFSNHRGLQKALLFSYGVITAFNHNESRTFPTFHCFSTLGRLADRQRLERHDVLSLFCSLPSLKWSKIFCRCIFFLTSTHLVVTLPSGWDAIHTIYVAFLFSFVYLKAPLHPVLIFM